jgi:dipeptidyl aminopeptidase/acylaminoacyl peptidase
MRTGRRLDVQRQRSRKRWTWITAPWLLAAAASAQAPQHRAIGIDDIITMRKPSEVQISPDGRWVAYVLTTPLLEQNSYAKDVYVAPADGSAPPRQLTHNASSDGYLASFAGLGAVWAPTSDRLIYVARRSDRTEIVALDARTGREETLVGAAALGKDVDLAPGWEGNALAFSPDGRTVAFTASVKQATPPSEKLLHAIEAEEDWVPESERAKEPVRQLFTLDLATGKLRALTDAGMNVASFGWSPDGRRIAFEGTTYLGPANYMSGDIYVVDLAGGAPRPLVQLDGWDQKPTWSPDGRFIAFGTQRGQVDWMYTESPAVIDADGKGPARFLGDRLEPIAGAGISSLHWTSDGRALDLVTRSGMSRHLFRVEVADGAVERLSGRDDRLYEDVSYSRDGATMALTIQGVGVPPDVWMSRTDRFAPTRLTHLNPEWDSLTVPGVERVHWKSNDGKWEIPALLIKPSDYVPGRRYPTLVAILGGPSGVLPETSPIWNYPLLTLAERGYVILMPNTRGRAGNGMAFTHANRDEHSYVANPFTDVMAGVDAMVARGIADPARLGVLGFSYGGSLTAYAITHTDRFAAAIYGEGSPSILGTVAEYSTKFFWTIYRDMWGIGSPFEPEDIKRMFAQSAIYQLDRVRTPVLIESGERSAWKTDRELYRGLVHFGVPAEFWVYPRSGHGWDEPKLMQDAYRRHIAWFDYWLLDRTYPDIEKQHRYDEWKAKRAKTR